ncbi:MAG: hypothetical protein ACREJC_07350 [Tepidisphaeraceae bacterium]
MSANAGNLLWSRQRITLTPGPLDVNTGIKQTNRNFGANSVGEPPLGVPGIVPPADGALPASRIQVLPMAPMAGWQNVTHSEPWYNTATGTVFVTFEGGGEGGEVFNVLFWDPATVAGPGSAQAYNPIL